MLTNIGFIRNENGLAVFENTLYEIYREYNLLVKYKIIKNVFFIYSDYIKLMQVWNQKNRYIILCEKSEKFRDAIIELPDVVKQIKKDCLETECKIIDNKVERYLYFMCRDIFQCDKNYKGY